MVWFVFGDQASIGIKDGVPFVSGSAKQDASNVVADMSLLMRLRKTEAMWSFHPTTAPEIEIDPRRRGLLRRIEARPEASHFMITHYPAGGGQSEAVGFSVCLPPPIFEANFSLWKAFTFGRSGLRYTIALDYLGFSGPGADDGNVSVNEWTDDDVLRQKSAFGHGVKLSFHSEPADTR